MEYLLKRIIAIGYSSQHYLSFDYVGIVGYAIFVHEHEDGSSKGCVESLNSWEVSQKEAVAVLDKWAEIIAKEREHDEAINASESRMDS